MTKLTVPNTHIVIPDTQVRPGVPTNHLDWIGWYIAEKYATKKNVTAVMLGDWYDMHGLSWYDRGKKSGEGSRVTADIEAGNVADERLVSAMISQGWTRGNRKVKLRGNHEFRLDRYYEDNPSMDGALPRLEDEDRWEIAPFKKVVWLDGVAYSHYFYHPNTGKPYGGQSMDTRLKQVGTSHTQGHVQGVLIGTRSVLGHRQWGLQAGSCYLHTETYRGPQAQDEWRGIIVCHNVSEGDYDPKLVSLDSLCRRYEKMTLADFMAKYHPDVR